MTFSFLLGCSYRPNGSKEAESSSWWQLGTIIGLRGSERLHWHTRPLCQCLEADWEFCLILAAMVIKTDTCSFSEMRIYPGHGSRFVRKDGQVRSVSSLAGGHSRCGMCFTPHFESSSCAMFPSMHPRIGIWVILVVAMLAACLVARSCSSSTRTSALHCTTCGRSPRSLPGRRRGAG